VFVEEKAAIRPFSSIIVRKGPSLALVATAYAESVAKVTITLLTVEI